jgi:hypothetical protein
MVLPQALQYMVGLLGNDTTIGGKKFQDSFLLLAPGFSLFALG